jgi:hypothetical protein
VHEIGPAEFATHPIASLTNKSLPIPRFCQARVNGLERGDWHKHGAFAHGYPFALFLSDKGAPVDSGFYAACAGLRAQSEALEVSAHNLANLNTAGFSPTIGIIGAVLGLIQVMQHLDKIDEVGKGIAVAFVATLYGVGAANILLLPAAGKLKIRLREEQIIREMTIEGVVSILEGMNPRILEEKLLGFLSEAHSVDRVAEASYQ